MNIVWPPSYTQMPHNHLLWAEIGVYTGREDNIFWRRSAPDAKWPIEVVGAVRHHGREIRAADQREQPFFIIAQPVETLAGHQGR